MIKSNLIKLVILVGAYFFFTSCRERVALNEGAAKTESPKSWVYYIEGTVSKNSAGVESSYLVRESGFESSLEKAWAKIKSFEPKMGKDEKFVPRKTNVSQR